MSCLYLVETVNSNREISESYFQAQVLDQELQKSHRDVLAFSVKFKQKKYEAVLPFLYMCRVWKISEVIQQS